MPRECMPREMLDVVLRLPHVCHSMVPGPEQLSDAYSSEREWCLVSGVLDQKSDWRQDINEQTTNQEEPVIVVSIDGLCVSSREGKTVIRTSEKLQRSIQTEATVCLTVGRVRHARTFLKTAPGAPT